MGTPLHAALAKATVRHLPCGAFVLALVTPNALVGLQVGDGAIVYRLGSNDAAGGIGLLTAPYQGEYLNETVFLTSDTCLQDARFAHRPGIPEGIALFSDGLQLLALDMKDRPPTPHAPFFDPLFDFVKGQPDALVRADRLRAFLESERVCARTDDDKTLVIAVRDDLPLSST